MNVNPFEAMFGQQQGKQKGPDINLKVNVELEDVYNGREIEVSYTKQIMCPFCWGSGAESDDDYKTCPHCGGKGHVFEKW